MDLHLFKLHRMDWRQHSLLQKLRTAPLPELRTLAPLADLPSLHSGLDHKRRQLYDHSIIDKQPQTLLCRQLIIYLLVAINIDL
jgi:hypothetical protein